MNKKAKEAIRILKLHKAKIINDHTIYVWALECIEYSKRYFGLNNEYEKSLKYITTKETSKSWVADRCIEITDSMIAYIENTGLPKTEKNFLEKISNKELFGFGFTIATILVSVAFYFGGLKYENEKYNLMIERNQLKDSLFSIRARNIPLTVTKNTSNQKSEKDTSNK